MVKRILLLLVLGFPVARVNAQLVLTDSRDFVIEDTIMGGLYLNNCGNVTIRHCSFSHNADYVVQFVNCDNIVLDSCELDGLGDACTGVKMSGSSYVTISNCDIYNIADDGVEMGSSNHVSFIGNKIHHLLGKGTDGRITGPCYNGHSDGFEIAGSSDVLLDGNLCFDIESTSCLILGNWGGNVKNLTLQNNIFYSPRTGFVLYIHYVDGVNIYNNVFWQGVYGGLALGQDVKNLKAYNNIMHSINLNHAGISYDPVNHLFDYNIIAEKNQGMPLQEHDIFILDPGFSGIPPNDDPISYKEVTADLFSLLPNSPAIDAAFVDEHTPVTDYFDSARVDYADAENKGAGLASYYDMGAIEFNGSTGQVVLKPVAAPQPGTYDEAVYVELTTGTDSAVIHYTLDGQIPTTSSARYEAPIELLSTTTITARAFKEGMYDSPLLWAKYKITADLVAPYIRSVIVSDAFSLRILFSEYVDVVTATDLEHYTIDDLSVTGASLDDDLSTVHLTVSEMEPEREYLLMVKGVRDRAYPARTMVPDTIAFVYSLAIHDDFEDGGKLDWSPKTPARWSLDMDDGRGTYHLNTTDYSQDGDMPGEYALLEDHVFQDFVLEITVKQPELNSGNAFADYGVIFGYTDASNFYYFLANKDPGSNELFRVMNGTRFSLLNLQESIIPDDDYHTFGFEVLDGYFYFETDDNDWAVEEDFPEGKVGLCSYNDEVFFDDFRITPVIEDPSGVHTYQKSGSDLLVYPNPASDYIDLETGDQVGRTVMLIITDMQGKQVYRNIVSRGSHEGVFRIPGIGKLGQGLFLVRIIDGHQQYVQKLVVR
jgi:hypothetical protein